MQRVDVKLGPDRSIVLLGVVQGLISEADAVEVAIRAETPDVVCIQLDPEEVDEVPEWRTVEPDSPEDLLYLQALSAFGDVELPPPDIRRAYAVARDLGTPITGIDVPEFDWVDEYTRRISALDLMRRGLRMRRGRRKLQRLDDPEAFSQAWDERANAGPFGELEAWRERKMSERIRKATEGGGSAVVVLELARLGGVHRALKGSRVRSD